MPTDASLSFRLSSTTLTEIDRFVGDGTRTDFVLGALSREIQRRVRLGDAGVFRRYLSGLMVERGVPGDVAAALGRIAVHFPAPTCEDEEDPVPVAVESRASPVHEEEEVSDALPPFRTIPFYVNGVPWLDLVVPDGGETAAWSMATEPLDCPDGDRLVNLYTRFSACNSGPIAIGSRFPVVTGHELRVLGGVNLLSALDLHVDLRAWSHLELGCHGLEIDRPYGFGMTPGLRDRPFLAHPNRASLVVQARGQTGDQVRFEAFAVLVKDADFRDWYRRGALRFLRGWTFHRP